MPRTTGRRTPNRAESVCGRGGCSLCRPAALHFAVPRPAPLSKLFFSSIGGAARVDLHFARRLFFCSVNPWMMVSGKPQAASRKPLISLSSSRKEDGRALRRCPVRDCKCRVESMAIVCVPTVPACRAGARGFEMRAGLQTWTRWTRLRPDWLSSVPILGSGGKSDAWCMRVGACAE